MKKHHYLTVKKPDVAETFVKKSRFIAHVSPASSVEAAEEFIVMVKEKHREATHNVYAYNIGSTGSLQRASDDGEPSGTAGRPILGVINKQGLQDVVVVVTRYFGGKLLGAGGLIRAYSQAAVEGISAAVVVKKVLHREFEVIVDYPLFGVLQRRIEELEIPLKKIDYTDTVRLVVLVKEVDRDVIKETFINLTNGQALINEGKAVYLDFNLT